MRKIEFIKDMPMYGGGSIKQGTILKVTKFNSRYIYAELSGSSTLVLLRKRDAEYFKELKLRANIDDLDPTISY